MPCQDADHMPLCHGRVMQLCQRAHRRSTTLSSSGHAVLCCVSHAALLVHCHMSPLFPAPSCIPCRFCSVGMEQFFVWRLCHLLAKLIGVWAFPLKPVIAFALLCPS